MQSVIRGEAQKIASAVGGTADSEITDRARSNVRVRDKFKEIKNGALVKAAKAAGLDFARYKNR